MTKEEILEAVNKLSTLDLEEFVAAAIALRAHRRAPSLPHSESELLLKINQGLPAELWERVDVLRAKLEDETLPPEERVELLQLNEQIEELNVDRVKLLAELADQRGVTLSKLMQDLEISTSYSLQIV